MFVALTQAKLPKVSFFRKTENLNISTQACTCTAMETGTIFSVLRAYAYQLPRFLIFKVIRIHIKKQLCIFYDSHRKVNINYLFNVNGCKRKANAYV